MDNSNNLFNGFSAKVTKSYKKLYGANFEYTITYFGLTA